MLSIASCAALIPSLLALCRKREHEEQKFLSEGEVSGLSMGKVAPLLGDKVMAVLASPLVLLGLKEKTLHWKSGSASEP